MAQKPMKLSFQADRAPELNSQMHETAGRLLIQTAVRERLILDEDLAMIPEVMPHFFKIAGDLRNDYYHHHQRINKALSFFKLRDCFCYCTAKGAEAAYLWNESSDGKITLSYDAEAAITGRPTPDPRIPEKYAMITAAGMMTMAKVFVAFQNEILLKNITPPDEDEDRYRADYMGCGLYWAAAIGLDYGMKNLGHP